MKVKTKILIITLIAIFAMLLMGATKVEAVEINADYMKEIVKSIPTKVSLNIPEVEFYKADKLVSEKVKDTLNEKNIDIANIEISASVSPIHLSTKDFYTGYVYLNYEEKGDYTEYHSKSNYHEEDGYSWYETYYDDRHIIRFTVDITVEYNNHSKYNSADETAVKNLSLTSPKYITYSIDDFNNGIYTHIANYYQKQVKDSSIKIYAMSGAGGDSIFNYGFDSDRLSLAVFKNGVLYDIKTTYVKVVCSITIPDDIEDTDEAYINYAKPIIAKELDHPDFTLSKGAMTGDIEIENGYTIKSEYGIEGTVILSKSKPGNVGKSVTKRDTSTGVKLESNTNVVPQDVVLDVNPLTSGNIYSIVEKSLRTSVSKFTLYDITLKQNNKNIQPNGKVKISIPVPAGYDTSKIAVYRIEEDGTKTEYAITINNGYITFETDHFSNYVVAQKATNAGANAQQPNKGELDETPKTGVSNMIYIILPIAVLAATGIIVLKKRETK